MTNATQDHTSWETWREITSQPAIWRGWADVLDVSGLRSWVAAQNVDEVWFCGAGTSAYIGDILVAGFEQRRDMRFRAVASTDLVSRPAAFLAGRRPLVVSFGRSGNSAESLGTLDALDALAPDAPRLNITCNGESALATRSNGDSQRVVVLPDGTHDVGFAMTSSFSTMLLTALSVFGVDADPTAHIRAAADAAETLLPLLESRTLSGPMPDRAVYAGTGPLTFAARESALKVMELAAGQVPALWDSSLGFRHGPKSFVSDGAALHVLLSSDPHAARYDADLAAELRMQFPKAEVTTIGPGGDIDIAYPNGDVWGSVLAVLTAQVQSVIWSTRMGFNADDPFVGQGTLTRVVADVKLYPVST